MKKFIKFGLVGGSGVVVDTAMLFLLSDPRMLGLNLSIAKALAAESAIITNFIFNDLWTFRDISTREIGSRARLGRFGRFNLICLAGVAVSILVLDAQVKLLHFNIYVANLIAIFVASLWNFWMNLKFGWIAPNAKTTRPGFANEVMRPDTPSWPSTNL